MPRQPRGTTVRIEDRSAEAGRKLPYGVIWNVYKPGFTGRPKPLSEWCATRAEAEMFAAKLRVKLERNEPVEPTVPTFWHKDSLAALAGYDYSYNKQADRKGVGPQFTGWLKAVQGKKQAATLKNYRDCVKNYLAPPKGHKRYPGLGNLIISNTTSTMPVFYAYLEELYEDGVSFSMRLRLKAALSALCGYGILTGKLTIGNPLAKLGKQLRHLDELEDVSEPNPFSGDEIARIFDQLEACEDDCWIVYFMFLLHVGVRVGEAAALKWDHVDLDAGTVVIEFSYSDAAGKDKSTKTYEKRTLKLSKEIVRRLAKWKIVQAERFMKSARGRSLYVFTTPRLARALPSGSMREVFSRTLTACTIPVGKLTETGKVDGGHTPHNFRDTFATSHLVKDWDKKLPWVSAYLGHKTPETTREYYYKYKPTADSASFADDIMEYGK
jgi:integrase